MIEPIIYQHLSHSIILPEYLTTYAGKPAIFNMMAPADTEPEWEDQQQYPRLIFELNMQEDPERKISGTLMVDYYYPSDAGYFREDIEPIIKKSLDGWFFSDETDTIAAQWQQTDPFTTPDTGNRIVGFTMTFNVIAFPSQLTTDPDPVKTLNDYIKKLYENCTLVGIDNVSQPWKPSEEKPAVYCRMTRIEPGKITGGYHVTWYDATIQVHILSPSKNTNSIVLKTIIEELQAATRIIMPDDSPFMINRMIVDNGADALRAGQLTVTGIYGVLRKYPNVPVMQNINVKE